MCITKVLEDDCLLTHTYMPQRCTTYYLRFLSLSLELAKLCFTDLTTLRCVVFLAVELGVVIGKGGKRIAERDALSHVGGR
jgi:hypothetical protein